MFAAVSARFLCVSFLLLFTCISDVCCNERGLWSLRTDPPYGAPLPSGNLDKLQPSMPNPAAIAAAPEYDIFQSSTDGIDMEEKETSPVQHKKPFSIASVDFGRVKTPFIIGVWIFCASLAKIGFHMAPRVNKIFPESCLLISVGVIIGVLLLHTTNSIDTPLTPDTFFFYMLPPIILDAGYFMPNRLFFDNLGTILIFAVIGTIFNTLTIGVSLWAVGKTNLFDVNTPLLDMFLFSALISAVDPVAVLAVFEEIHVNEILYIVVFGESLLNDAVTVVLYHMFESYTEMGPNNIEASDLFAGFASFFVVALGGTFIGVLWGFLTALVTRFTHEVRVIEPIFIFVMAYLAYLNAEIFHMSGILAITFCGITMKNYVESNISHKSHTTIKYAMKMLSSSSETIIFMFLGVATVNDKHQWNTWFVILTIVFCSIYRTIGVIMFTALVNRFRLYKLSKVEKFVMSYGGLRGAVAFALVLLISPKVVPLQPMFVTTTIAVIYFTVFFQGITIKPLVRILKVKRADKRKPTMNERIHERFMDHMMAGIEDILGHHGNHHLRDKFKRFDNKFIRPLLLRDHQGAEPKILETYSKLAMKDAMDYMRRNASTIGNISGTESMSAIFKNYTSGNFNGNLSGILNGSTSFTQLDNSTWNIDMQELEYNPSKKDLTDAKIHHLLAEELCQPYRRHRRLSYSRHAVDDRDLTTQVNYRMQMNMRRTLGERKHHKRSKRLGKDGKPGHVSFPGITQNGSVKQFSHDYINEVLHENDDSELRVEEIQLRAPPSGNREDWDNGITFTAKSSHEASEEATTSTENPENVVKSATKGAESSRVTTPTATEAVLPWKRDEENDMNEPVKQNEFPPWSCNKEYLAYNSPSATFLGGIEQPKMPSIIGLFRRESTSSVHDSRTGSDASLHPFVATDSPTGTVLLIEEGPSTSGGSRRPQAGRRGSMLELGASVNPIPEEEPPHSERQDHNRGSVPRLSLQNTLTRLPTLSPSSSSESSDGSIEDEEDELTAIHRTHSK